MLLLLLFSFAFVKISFEREEEQERDLPFADSLPTWLRWPGPGQGFISISHVGEGAKLLGHPALPFLGHQQGTGYEMEAPSQEPGLHGMLASLTVEQCQPPIGHHSVTAEITAEAMRRTECPCRV